MVGMNPEQVEITLGEPNTVSANGTGTLWYYELLKNGEMFEQVVPFYVTFQNGVVTNFGASGAVRDGRREQMQAVHDAANELSESVKPAPVRPLIQPIQCRTRPDGFGGATTNCGP